MLHIEQAAQLLFKGLLRGTGFSSLTFIHGLRTLAERCRDHLGMEITEQELADLKRLERDYQPMRYLDALVEGTPRGAYNKADYERALATFTAARERADAVWSALVAASQDDEDEGG